MIKLPKVKAKYPKDVDMISFERIDTWDFVALSGFQYDNILDEDIVEALQYKYLDLIVLDVGWEDDGFLSNDDEVREELKHAIRVAALVKLIQSGGGIVPVNLDTYAVNFCFSCIADGHHRIRALQYLGYTHFPAYCSGNVKELKYIIGDRVNKQIVFLGG